MTEYAPEYTKKERFSLILKYFAFFALFFCFFQFWFLPWFKRYVENSHCLDYGFFTGLHVVFYFVFVFIPFVSGLLVFILEGGRSIRVIQLGQNPLPGEKVYKRTKYTYGAKAKIKPYGVFLIIAFFLAFSIKGIFWANAIIYSPDNNPPLCDNAE